jgi:hypothetical protein
MVTGDGPSSNEYGQVFRITICSFQRYLVRFLHFASHFLAFCAFYSTHQPNPLTQYLNKDSPRKSILSSHDTVDELICGVTGIYVRSTNHNATMRWSTIGPCVNSEVTSLPSYSGARYYVHKVISHIPTWGRRGSYEAFRAWGVIGRGFAYF